MIELDAMNAAEARAALEREARNNATINRCLRLARITGLNTEDTYSLLAYHLVIAFDQMQKVALDLANTELSRPFHIINPGEVNNV